MSFCSASISRWATTSGVFESSRSCFSFSTCLCSRSSRRSSWPFSVTSRVTSSERALASFSAVASSATSSAFRSFCFSRLPSISSSLSTWCLCARISLSSVALVSRCARSSSLRWAARSRARAPSSPFSAASWSSCAFWSFTFWSRFSRCFWPRRSSSPLRSSCARRSAASAARCAAPASSSSFCLKSSSSCASNWRPRAPCSSSRAYSSSFSFFSSFTWFSWPMLRPAPFSTSLLSFSISSLRLPIVSFARSSFWWAASTIFHARSISLRSAAMFAWSSWLSFRAVCTFAALFTISAFSSRH
mmetsp:Transcript_12232/g.18930  ORF Transcript_12232/g.18930 Transcript_12232/m.18930 type:complete len:303 (-) Transcript_12232:26-934(-)